ncbi:MAG TPA: protein kinase, partial [Trichormus sp.]
MQAKDDNLLKQEDFAPASAPSAHSETPNMPTLKPGTIVEGRLEVQSLIASGGFGSVYRVRHVLMHKTLALKTLHPVVKSDTTILRLKRESVAVAKLDHPNIVHATDFGLIDGTIPFIVMEYVDGKTLSEYMKGRPPLS